MRISDWSSDVCSSDLQMICRIQFRRASYKGFFTPPEADRRSFEYPGYNGGTDWGGVAVDPARGVIVADRKSVVSGKSVSLRVALGGCRIIKKKKTLYVTLYLYISVSLNIFFSL